MSRPLRLTLALVTLTISLILLGWAFWPQAREVRRQLLEPTEMQLPTPEGYSPLEKWAQHPEQALLSLEAACLF